MIEFVLPIISVLLLILSCLYLWLTRNFSRNEVKNHLKLCLDSFIDDLKLYLIKTEGNTINNLILDYLEDKSTEKLMLVVDYLRNKHAMSRYSSLTQPAKVMKTLVIEIMEEQLKSNYDNGFYLSKETFDNLEKEAPFVKNFCLIARMNEERYYTDVCEGMFTGYLNSMILYSFDNLLRKVTKGTTLNYDDLIFPPTVVVLFSKAHVKYNFDLRTSNLDRFITLYNGKNYGLGSIVLNISKLFRFGYVLRTGAELKRKGTSSGFFTVYTNSFLSFMVLKSNDLE